MSINVVKVRRPLVTKTRWQQKKHSNSYYPLINYCKLTWLVEISTFSIGNTVHLTNLFHFPARPRQSTRVYHVFFCFFSRKKPGHKIPLPIDRLKVPGEKKGLDKLLPVGELDAVSLLVRFFFSLKQTLDLA